MNQKTKESTLNVNEAQTNQTFTPPPLYKVLLINDDYTTMEFVIEVLQKFFRMTPEKATSVMLQVHQNGKAICGVYPFGIAETKVSEVTRYARKNEHPLLCILEST